MKIILYIVFFLVVAFVAALTAAAWWGSERLPGSFLPTEDQGILITLISTPAGTTAPITNSAVEEVEAYLDNDEADTVDGYFSVIGFSFSGSGQNEAIMFTRLRDFDERDTPELGAAALANRLNGRRSSSPSGVKSRCFPVSPKPQP